MATTKIFVGSLPPGSKPEELRRLFENYGVVTECDVMNRCGFVHMETPDMADNAIKALHETQFKGENIVVEPGRPKDRKRGGGGPGGPPAGRGGNRGMGGGRGGPMGGRGGRGGGMMGGAYPSGGPPRGRGGGKFGSGGGGGNRGGFDRNNGVGPMRTDNFRGQQRNAPYSRGGGGARFGGDKFGAGSQGGGKFGGGGSGGYDSNPTFDNWQSNAGGNRNFNDNKGFGKGGFGGGNQGQMSAGGMGNQDRRGFALPGGMDQPIYGEAPEDVEADMFPRRSGPPNMGGGGRGGGFGNARGGGGGGRGGRGGSGRGGGGFGGGRGGLHNAGGGGGFSRGGLGGNRNTNQFQDEFPPLRGGASGGFNRNAPRPNMMSNRQY